MKIKKSSGLRSKVAICGLGLVGIISLHEAAVQASDFLFSTPQERSLEKRIGKPIYFGFATSEDYRNRQIASFENTYSITKNNWDNFEQQFNLIDRIYITDKGIFGDYKGFANPLTHTLIINISLGSSYLSHELSHMWNYSLGFDYHFYREWSSIYGRNHIIAGKKEKIAIAGSVSDYALKNIFEDIAVTAQFVYRLNNPDIKIKHFPNIPPFFRVVKSGKDFELETTITRPAVPKIIRKISLLREYNFISEREYLHAVSELRGFSAGADRLSVNEQ